MFHQVAAGFCKVLQIAGLRPGSPQKGGSWLADVTGRFTALTVGRGSALPPAGLEVQFSTSYESSQGCFGMGSLSRKLIMRPTLERLIGLIWPAVTR